MNIWVLIWKLGGVNTSPTPACGRSCVCMSVLHTSMSRGLTVAPWTARPWRAASPLICWTRLLRPLKSENTTSDRRRLKPQTPPVRSMDIISETRPIYTAPVGARGGPSARLADNLNAHASDKEKSSDGNITGVILKWKCYFIMKANRINSKLLLQKLRAALRVQDNVNSKTCSAYCADCLLLFGDSISRLHFYSWPPGGSEVTLKQEATARCGVRGYGNGNIWSGNIRNNRTVRRVHQGEMWSFKLIYETENYVFLKGD